MMVWITNNFCNTEQILRVSWLEFKYLSGGKKNKVVWRKQNDKCISPTHFVVISTMTFLGG